MINIHNKNVPIFTDQHVEHRNKNLRHLFVKDDVRKSTW
nr:MAG TPA: hypothetical protein [Bacteriophage sp.]